MRNRGPREAATATVKLHWAQFGTALPPLPVDFWSQFPADSSRYLAMASSQLRRHERARRARSTDLAYSGASVAMTSGDAAQIVQFDFPAPAVDPALSSHFRLLAVVDSLQDPISQVEIEFHC